ncbi:MAG: DUF885 family protein [Pirellulales bacterium]
MRLPNLKTKLLLSAVSALSLSLSNLPDCAAQTSSQVPSPSASKPVRQASKQAQVATASPASGIVEQIIREFSEDQDTLNRRYRVKLDRLNMDRRDENLQQWLQKLKTVEFATLDRSGKLDYVLLRNKLEYLIAKHGLDKQRDLQAAEAYIPFAEPIVAFCVNRENVESIKPDEVAGQLDSVAASIEKLTGKVKSVEEVPIAQKLSALRAVELVKSLKNTVTESDNFYQGYDPIYSWWCKKPVERLKAALEKYATYLQDRVVGVPESDVETIIGQPIGVEGIALELKHEWIAHSPEELVKLAEREMAWCEAEMQKASTDLGCQDWRQALTVVKQKHVQPGQQPQMIRDLAEEAIDYMRKQELVTVTDMAAKGWRMTMMSPERQRVNPYFLGGESIIVSFPTDSMTHEEKLMSLRSNNEHFARATVHHELIPGHHLQYYSLARFRPYRGIFSTPFWVEGWALHFEMLLWDMNFARGPEDKIGMLFWRKHRCARIIFSLNYHLGKMTPAECVEYLVENVGHERSAAAAEVRRSIMGGYGPMYQAAYMLGGKQIRKMHHELVASGKMTSRDFHDAILQEHAMPIEPLRHFLSGSELTPDMKATWKFAE